MLVKHLESNSVIHMGEVWLFTVTTHQEEEFFKFLTKLLVQVETHAKIY
jgi:hypothetical protein